MVIIVPFKDYKLRPGGFFHGSPLIGLGWVGLGWVGSGRAGPGRVGSGRTGRVGSGWVGYRTPGRDYNKDSSKEETSQLLTCRGGLGETLYNTLRALIKRCSIQAQLAHVIIVRLCHIRLWLSAGGCGSSSFGSKYT